MQIDFTEKQPCELTRDEKLRKADQMAQHFKTRAEKEVEAKSIAEGYKRELKTLDHEIADRAEEVRTGVEYRNVDCAERARYRDNQVDVIRLDTGEVVRSRPMTITERQDSLNFDTDETSSARQ
jgi:uncharacterized FlaG/YvyC family protein